MAYATYSDMLARYDANRVGQLVRDDGTQASATALVTDSVLSTVLDDASQELRAALIAGKRYSDADISACLSGTGAAYLKRLTCDIAYGLLMSRRGYPAKDIADNTPRVAAAISSLAAIRNGDAVLDIAGDNDGGNAAASRVVLSKNVSLVTAASRLFGDLTVPTGVVPTQGDLT